MENIEKSLKIPPVIRMTAAPDGKAVVRFIGESDICMSACKALEETGAALFIGSDE